MRTQKMSRVLQKGKMMNDRERRIKWLIDNQHVWVDEYDLDPDFIAEKMASHMKACGLYAVGTTNIRNKKLLREAKKRIDKEMSSF